MVDLFPLQLLVFINQGILIADSAIRIPENTIIIGILSISLISILFLIFLNHQRRINKEVEGRTRELANINRSLHQEINKRELVEAKITQTQASLQKRLDALDYLTKFTISEPEHAIQEVIYRTALVMEIDRVSALYYQEEEGEQKLLTMGTYVLSTNSFNTQLEFNSRSFPRYFKALSAHSHLIIPTTDNPELNQELSSYLAAFHITSKLDIPIIFEGKLLGSLSCEESRGHREWHLEDRHFGQTIAEIIAIMMTQSARRKAEKAQQESEERLLLAIKEAQEANAAKNEFLATISHELRTPLNAIIGFNQCLLMEMDGPINEEQKTSLKKIENSSFHLLELINGILDLAKIEAHRIELDKKFVNLVEIIHSAVEEMQLLADQKNLTLSFNLPGPSVMIEIDQVWIKQVLINLLSNAIKFTEKGTIDIALHDFPDHIEMTVADTGIGLTPEEAKKIFNPFTQADSSITRKFGGTGLGLTICRNIVKLHGGKISVKSKKGIGSAFIISLPKRLNLYLKGRSS